MVRAEDERVKSAASRLRAFFEELRGAFFERDDLLQQAALALLSREHVLITGPPGTAKSRLAWAVLGRIVDEQTGEPSLYSRQFTESTVQTDLVGPIDFKTLMETGRTEHFTDEGMLGAVHAFLDEVFDGRDMLLRSTLNVLHERELKQGTKTTQGRIECAILTTNRYLAEVLEGSREALLAFVDRIAHVAFVPKNFGDAATLTKLLRSQFTGATGQRLGARLTIQDLDALQELVTTVSFPPQLCDLLAEFVRNFEIEIAAAVRADPGFVPTRYMSTRTVVRLGNLLRAACVYDWAMNGQKRKLRVERDDFAALRLTLVLCGPSPEHLDALLETEPDPRERRQLETVKTEQAIFWRCLAKLPELKLPETGPELEASLRAASEAEQLRSSSPEQLLETTHKLGQIVARTGHDDPAGERLRAAVNEIRRRAFHAAHDAAFDSELSPLAAVERLSKLADEMEQLSPGLPAVGHWLRGQALEIVQHTLRLAPTAGGKNLEEWLEAAPDLETARAASHERLRRVAQLLEVQTALIARGAPQKPGTSAEPARVALERLKQDLALLWDGVVRRAAESAGAGTTQELTRLLDGLQEPLAAVREIGKALSELGSEGSPLDARVFGPRIAPLVRSSCERFEAGDRRAVVAQVERLLDTLERYGFGRTVSPAELLTWLASTLLRSEPDWKAALARCPENTTGYRKLRRENERRSLTFTLSELALSLQARSGKTLPSDVLAPVRELTADLPAPLRERIVAADLARIEAPLRLLEATWQDVSTDTDSAERRLKRLAKSRFLHLTLDEAALVRLALEAKLLAEVFPEADVGAVERRIRELEQQTNATLRELMSASLDEAWRSALGAEPK